MSEEEPDTPIATLQLDPSMNLLLMMAQQIEDERMVQQRSAAREEYLKETLLPLMTAKSLHGILLQTGAAIRRHWFVRATTIPEPARLREVLGANAPDYIREVVDMPKLKTDFPAYWEQLGKVKRKETIAVYLVGEK